MYMYMYIILQNDAKQSKLMERHTRMSDAHLDAKRVRVKCAYSLRSTVNVLF